MKCIDLNCDLGESFGEYQLGLDEQVIPYITSANIACGYHAGDPIVMSKTVELAKNAGVSIGAHPGFPDLMGFGRRNISVSPNEVKAYIQYQIGALDAFCKAHGTQLVHVKPHGALYNMAGKDTALAHAVCEGIIEVNPGLILLALSGSEMIKAAEDTGLKAAKEAFADRNYEEDGSLVSRTKSGAIIEDENLAIERVVKLVNYGKVETITGKEMAMQAHSICVHGDGSKVLTFVKKIRAAFETAGIDIAPLKTVTAKGEF